MNILLINHYAGSPLHGMEFRPYYLAKAWLKLGHKVTIVGSSFSHVRSVQPKLKNKIWSQETVMGVDYIWLHGLTYKGNGVVRALSMFVFVLRLFLLSKALINICKPNVVIASSTYPMDIWPASYIAQASNAKLVYEVHDLWPLSPIQLGGMSKANPFIQIVQAAENFCYKKSDLVVSIIPKIENYFFDRKLDVKKFAIIENGIDFHEQFSSHPPLSGQIKKFLDNLRVKNIRIVGYAGAFGIANELGFMLDIAKAMKDDRDVYFILVGDGGEREKLLKRIKTEDIENIALFETINKAQIPSLLEYFDIAYIGLQNQPLFRYGVSPNKLMDYMASSKPILFSILAGNSIVDEVGCGVTIVPGDVVAARIAINNLLSLDLHSLSLIGGKGKRFISENRSYEALAAKFIEECEGLK